MVAMSGGIIVPGSTDPVMPDDFDAEHARKWDEVLALLRARGAPIGEYGDVVRIYVLSFVEAKRARAHVAEHGAIVPAPRTGIPTHNPYRKVAQEAELQVARLADVLGMTPTSRAKVSRAPLLPPPVDRELGTLRLATSMTRSTSRTRREWRGRLDRGHLSGRHDGEAAADDRADRLRSGASRRHSESRTRALRTRPGGAGLHPLSPRSDDRRRHDRRRNLANAKGRMVKARARMAEAEADLLDGSLLRRAAVEAAWERVLVALRMRILALPAKAAPVMHAAPTLAEASAVLTTAVHDVLTELARIPVYAADAEGAGGIAAERADEPDDPEAAATADDLAMG